jgi:hypothetical protein
MIIGCPAQVAKAIGAHGTLLHGSAVVAGVGPIGTG